MKNHYLIIGIVLVSIFLTACIGQKDLGPITPELKRQWALSADASDSYGGKYAQGTDDQSAYAATGKPDVNECGDDVHAWVIGKEDDGLHWLELKYYDEVYATKVRVKESFNPGAVVKIELKDDDEYYTLWEGSYSTRDCPYWLEKEYVVTEVNSTFSMPEFKTDTVRLTLDTDAKGWNEIDAVELIGYTERWYLLNGTIYYE